MEPNISILLNQVKGATAWSETRLAQEIGTSQPTVNRILRGQTECMSRTLSAILSLHRTHCAASQFAAGDAAQMMGRRKDDLAPPGEEQS